MKYKFLLPLILFTAVACAHKAKEPDPVQAAAPKAPPPPTAGASIEAKEVAAEEQDPYVTEFKFAKGKQVLTKPDQARLKKFFDEASKHGKIAGVTVISWADQEYPSVHTKKLAKGQIELANARAGEIENRVHQIDGGVKVEKMNMAERPNGFAEWIGTADARVKKSLEVAGIPNTDTSVKAPAKASRAIVLVSLHK